MLLKKSYLGDPNGSGKSSAHARCNSTAWINADEIATTRNRILCWTTGHDLTAMSLSLMES